MRLFKRNDPFLDEDLQKLEAQLQAVLQPVSLRPQFIQNLRHRLITGDFPAPQKFLPQKLSGVLLIAGGILGSLLVFIAGIRGIIALIGVIGPMIQRSNKTARPQQPTPA